MHKLIFNETKSFIRAAIAPLTTSNLSCTQRQAQQRTTPILPYNKGKQCIFYVCFLVAALLNSPSSHLANLSNVSDQNANKSRAR